MRLLRMMVSAVVICAGCAAVSQESNTDAVPLAKQESQTKSPCAPPNAVFTPAASPPPSWERKGPKSAITLLEVTVDKKGKVHDLLVIQSGGDDADKEAIEAVRRWRFKPARCGTDTIETKVRVKRNNSFAMTRGE